MELDRDALVSQLRSDGHDDKADKAERERPKKVRKDAAQGSARQDRR
jgi:hypothetical protein